MPWLDTPSLACSSDFICVDIKGQRAQPANEASEVTFPSDLLTLFHKTFWLFQRQKFLGGEAEYFYLNCGCDLSSLSSGSLSKLGHIHVTHACLRSRIRCLACCPSLPPGQGAAAVGVGEVGALCSWTHTLPMCPQLSWTWAGL